MAKSQTNQATSAAGSLIGQAQSATAPVIGGLNSSVATQTGNQAGLYSNLTGALGQNQTTGGYDPTQLGTLRGETAGNAASGGYDPGAVSGIQNTGGYNPALLSQVTAGASAGYDPTAAGTISSGYTNFANNGGFSAQDQTNFINSATEGVASTSDVLQQQAKQATQKSGGFGGAGAVAQIARQLGQTQAQAGVDASTSLNQQINANKQAGLAGLNSSQATQAGLAQSGAGILAGVAGNQANNAVGITESQAANRLAGTNQQIGLESGVAQGATEANSQLGNLYNTTTGEITTQGQQVLSALGLNFGTQAEAINALTQLSKNPSTLQTIFSDVLGVAGAATGIGKVFNLGGSGTQSGSVPMG